MGEISASSRRQPAPVKVDPCEGSDCPAKPETSRWLCVSCDCTYCDLCWENQAPHKQGKLGQNGLPHEKTSKDVFERLRSIFEPPEKKSELLKLHLEDEETLWFGIEKDENNKYIFNDNGRYTTLMTMTKQPTATERYPLLVSFVGQTGKPADIQRLFNARAKPYRRRKKHINQDACISERVESEPSHR
jgi:hypothetical protein